MLTEFPSIMGFILDKVVGPDVARPLGAQAHAGAVVQPETAAFWLLLWDFQPLPSPDPLDPLSVYNPAGIAQESCDAPVAIASIGFGEFDNVGGESRLIVSPFGGVALRGSRLTKDGADPPFGNAKRRFNLIHASAATGGA